MNKKNQKRKFKLNKQRCLGFIVLGLAILIGFISEGDLTASVLVGILGLAAIVGKTDEDESGELKSINGKEEEL